VHNLPRSVTRLLERMKVLKA